MNTVDPNVLQEILDYNPETGHLLWLSRDERHFLPTAKKSSHHQKLWFNKRYAGKPAFKAKCDGYLVGTIYNKKFKAHRVAWAMHYGFWPVNDIDHINGDRTDNRIENLREVTRADNSKNRGLSSKNKSGFLGVYWDGLRNRWRAEIGGKARRRTIGYFKNIEEAAAARKFAEIEFGYHQNHGGRICKVKL